MEFKDEEEFTIKKFVNRLGSVADNLFKIDITTQLQDNYRPRNVADINYGTFYLLDEDTTEEELLLLEHWMLLLLLTLTMIFVTVLQP